MDVERPFFRREFLDSRRAGISGLQVVDDGSFGNASLFFAISILLLFCSILVFCKHVSLYRFSVDNIAYVDTYSANSIGGTLNVTMTKSAAEQLEVGAAFFFDETSGENQPLGRVAAVHCLEALSRAASEMRCELQAVMDKPVAQLLGSSLYAAKFAGKPQRYGALLFASLVGSR